MFHLAAMPNWSFNWTSTCCARCCQLTGALGDKEPAVRKSTIATTLLGIALIASNAWWAYHALDAGVSYTYQGVTLEENRQGLAQALAIINSTASQGASRAEVIAAAQNAWPSSEPFEKEGYLWVGRLGLRFNDAGQLVEAVPGF